MPPFGPVKINQQVEIEIVTNQVNKFRTKVENVTEQFLEILAPMEKGVVVAMHSGMSVKVSYFDDLAIYSLYVQVIRQRRGQFATVMLGSPTRFTRIQRRNYVRIDTSIEVEARKQAGAADQSEQQVEPEKKIESSLIRDRILRNNRGLGVPAQTVGVPQPAPADEKSEEPTSEPAIRTIPGTTTDLSGGGLMFRCNTVMKLGEQIEITVFLGEETVKAVGKVVRFVQMPAHTKYKYSVGLEFTEINEKERDKIIKYIFKKQLEFRKKGLL